MTNDPVPTPTPPDRRRLTRAEQLTLTTWRWAFVTLCREVEPQDLLPQVALQAVLAQLRDYTDPLQLFGRHGSAAADFALVGMHIAARTVSSPTWIWATFEHVDNTAVNDLEKDSKGRTLRPTFFNPDNPTKPVNVLAARNSAGSWPGVISSTRSRPRSRTWRRRITALARGDPGTGPRTWTRWTPGRRDAPASRWSTPACGSSSPKGSCITGPG